METHRFACKRDLPACNVCLEAEAVGICTEIWICFFAGLVLFSASSFLMALEAALLMLSMLAASLVRLLCACGAAGR
jgi:hypothetical protein